MKKKRKENAIEEKTKDWLIRLLCYFIHIILLYYKYILVLYYNIDSSAALYRPILFCCQYTVYSNKINRNYQTINI